MDKNTEYLVSYGSSLKYEDLTPDVIHKTEGLLIDSLGCALGAYSSDPAKIARQMCEEIHGCGLPATVIGSAYPTTPELATFANGIMIRYLDFNDSYTIGAGGHPSDNFASVLTCADAVHATGKELLIGSVLAYEVFCRINDKIGRSNNAKGFDHPTQGAISTVMGAAKILKLSEEQTFQALNLAIAPNVTLLQTRYGDVSMWKGCAMANASRNAVFAARLAKAGMTGPAPIFEGMYGFFNVVSGPFEFDRFGGRGGQFRILGVSIKRYPCGNVAETDIDAAVALRSKIGSIEDISEVNIETWDLAKGIMAGDKEKWNPKTRETADHSLPYVVAIALTYGTLEKRHFDERFVNDPAIHALIQKIKVEATEECNKLRPDAAPAKMEIVTKSGKRFSETVLHWRGHFKNPLTDQEIEDKFNSQAEELLSSAQRRELLSLLWNLEKVDDVSKIMQLLKV